MHFPHSFIDFHTGRVLGTRWYRMDESVFDAIEHDGVHYSRLNKCEVDILEHPVMPSGKMGAGERIGMRVNVNA